MCPLLFLKTIDHALGLCSSSDTHCVLHSACVSGLSCNSIRLKVRGQLSHLSITAEVAQPLTLGFAFILICRSVFYLMFWTSMHCCSCMVVIENVNVSLCLLEQGTCTAVLRNKLYFPVSLYLKFKSNKQSWKAMHYVYYCMMVCP